MSIFYIKPNTYNTLYCLRTFLSTKNIRRMMNPTFKTVIPQRIICLYSATPGVLQIVTRQNGFCFLLYWENLLKMLGNGVVQRVPGKVLEWLGNPKAVVLLTTYNYFRYGYLNVHQLSISPGRNLGVERGSNRKGTQEIQSSW